MRHTHPGYNRKSRDLQCANSRDCSKRAKRNECAGLEKVKKTEETAKKCRKTDSDQMKELLKRYVNWNRKKVEKEVKDVKLQIRRAAEFLQNSFPGGAEVVLFEANLARSPALRAF